MAGTEIGECEICKTSIGDWDEEIVEGVSKRDGSKTVAHQECLDNVVIQDNGR